MRRAKPPSQRDKASRYQVEKMAAGVNKALRAGAVLTPEGVAGMAMAGVRPRKQHPHHLGEKSPG